MLFDTGPDVFESEKERNFYYKVLAGYFFNEHVAGHEGRLRDFCRLLDETPHRGAAASTDPVALNPGSTHVSFDNHVYRFRGCNIDRGELADILIHDRSTNTVITIEAKVHSDWTYDKDILGNEARVQRVESRMPGARFVPCLLLARNKWLNGQRMANHPGSQYRRFVESPDNRFRVLLWEDVADACGAVTIRKFVETALADRTGEEAYGFSNGWFARIPV